MRCLSCSPRSAPGKPRWAPPRPSAVGAMPPRHRRTCPQGRREGRGMGGGAPCPALLSPQQRGPKSSLSPCLPSEAVLQERQPQQQHHQQLRAQQQQQHELWRGQQRQQHVQQEQLRLRTRHGGGPHGCHGHPQPVHALPRDAAEPVHQATGPVHRAGTLSGQAPHLPVPGERALKLTPRSAKS